MYNKEQDIENNVESRINSYLTKEEFINILNSIEFESIKQCRIELITGFIVNLETAEIKPLTKNIDID